VCARGDSDEPPIEIEPLFDPVEQLEKRTPDVAKADERKGEVRLRHARR